MKYTKQERKQIASAFRDARELIASDDERYICYALGGVCLEGAEEALQIVQERLDQPKNFTLTDWLHRVHGIDTSFVDDYEEQMRLYRLRWLDALIKEFSE